MAYQQSCPIPVSPVKSFSRLSSPQIGRFLGSGGPKEAELTFKEPQETQHWTGLKAPKVGLLGLKNGQM